MRGDMIGDVASLGEGIGFGHEALKLCPTGHADRANIRKILRGALEVSKAVLCYSRHKEIGLETIWRDVQRNSRS